MSKLTAKQELFIREYLVDLNATRAAIRAGYSENSAQEIGNENLRKPQIKSAIDEEMAKRTKKVEVTIEDVLKDILETRECTAEMGENHNRLKANELLGKYLSMWTDKIEHSGEIDTTINIVRARKGD